MSMQDNCRNIYKTARLTAGLTQERWAETLNISVESVRLYERGLGLPSDEVVARMVEVAVLPVLGYWHLKNKSSIANDILPGVEHMDLPQAVIKLLVAIRDFKENSDELLTIAADGIVSDSERSVFEEIIDDLDDIIRASLAVKFVRGKNDNIS